MTADSALVIVLTDADGVDELFFGAEGIAKGTCVFYRSTFACQPSVVSSTSEN